MAIFSTERDGFNASEVKKFCDRKILMQIFCILVFSFGHQFAHPFWSEQVRIVIGLSVGFALLMVAHTVEDLVGSNKVESPILFLFIISFKVIGWNCDW